ncbi:small subunit ribosomal protein S10, partial [Phenoliferia sp. Uapishka_3]
MSAIQRLTRSLRQVRLNSTLATAEVPQVAHQPPPPAFSSAVQGTSTSASAPSASPVTPSPNTSRPARTPPARAPIAANLLPTPTFSHHVPLVPKHNIHVATLHLRSHTLNLAHLDFFTSFALRSARALGLPTTGAIALPTRTSLYTVPRSPFAHKKSQENFWRKEHRRAIKVFDGEEEVVGAWLAYLRKEAMGGVGMKAQVFTYREVGWGEKMVGVDGLRETSAGDEADQVRALAAELEGELSEGIKETEKIALDSGSGEVESKQPRILDEVPEAGEDALMKAGEDSKAKEDTW